MAPMIRKSRKSNNVSRYYSGVLLLSLFLSLVWVRPVEASKLLSASVGSRSRNASLLVLKFDVPVRLSFQVQEGKRLVLTGGDITEAPESFRPSGLIKGLHVDNGDVVIDAKRYIRARVTSAGAGIFLVVLEPAKEPPATEQRRAETQQPKTQTQTEPNEQTGASIVPETPPDQSTEHSPPPASEAPEVEREATPPISLQDQGIQSPSTNNNMFAGQMRKTLGDLYEWVPVQPVVLPTTVQFALELSQQGNRDRAILLLESIKPDEPEYGWSRIALGRMMEQSGDFNKALDYYRQALQDRETEGVAAVRIALAFQAVGNHEAAVGLWERVLDMNQGQIYVDPSEMPVEKPQSPTYAMQPSGVMSSPSMQQDTRTAPAMQQSETATPDTSQDKIQFAGKNSSTKSKKSRFLAFLKYWPYVVGLLGFITLLYFGLLWIKKRAGGHEYDLNEDVASLGIDLDEHDEEPDAAGPRVADMYAKQAASTGSDDEIQIDDDSGAGPEVQLDDDFQLSEDKIAQVREMHAQGTTVREIAEELGLGQDEVRMAIRLAEAGQ